MVEGTPLDRAHDAMQSDEDDAVARMQFYDRLSAAELFLLLEEQAGTQTAKPKLLTIEGTKFALAFDREERLAEFAGEAACLVLSGRALTKMLASEGLGLGLNLEVAPSALLLPPDAVGWLAETANVEPVEVRALPHEIAPPAGVAGKVIEAIAGKLSLAVGLARSAWLVEARHDDGRAVPLLAVIGAPERAHGALARAVHEALAFAGADGQTLDIAFFDAGAPICQQIERVGLGFDLTPEPAASAPGSRPGMDREHPPRLK